MLFGFKAIRFFQVILSFGALLCGVGSVVSLKVFADDKTWYTLPIGMLLALVFFWLFATTLRAPTSFVAVDLNEKRRTRIRFAGFVDTVIDNRDILGVRLKHRTILGGVGVRTNFSGDVALLSSWGDVAELTLRNPIRIWLIPKLIPLRASRLTLSVRSPQRLVDQFGEPSTAAASKSASPVRTTSAKRRTKRP